MTMPNQVTLPFTPRGRRVARIVPEPEPGRVPRVSRLMALAIKLDGLLRDGVVRDQRELAGLCQVTPARVTQLLNLTHLAPDLQEAVLDLPLNSGRDAITESELRPIAAQICWKAQRAMWQEFMHMSGKGERGHSKCRNVLHNATY